MIQTAIQQTAHIQVSDSSGPFLAVPAPTDAPGVKSENLSRNPYVYGLGALESWGGKFVMAFVPGDKPCEVIVSRMASPANNPESAFWTEISQKFDLLFLTLPEDLLENMANQELGMTRVKVPWGLLRGVDRKRESVARSREAIFCRNDIPDAFVYDVASYIDMHRVDLSWYIRSCSYDPNTVWKNFDLPLHPGAEKYYRKTGHMT